MNSLPTFPLFPDPLRENVFKESNDACSFCGQSRAWLFTAGFAGIDDSEELNCCPWCISDGTAAARGAVFNDPTIYPCFDTTPQLNEEDQRLVEGRTPGFVTWQDHGWQMCCGRACVYIGEARTGDLQGRWAGAVPAIFPKDEITEEIKANVLSLIGKSASPAAYVFQCRECGGLKGFWDRG